MVSGILRAKFIFGVIKIWNVSIYGLLYCSHTDARFNVRAQNSKLCWKLIKIYVAFLSKHDATQLPDPSIVQIKVFDVLSN